MLDNKHRFKEDPDYGQMMNEFWLKDPTQAHCKRIMTRRVGRKMSIFPNNYHTEQPTHEHSIANAMQSLQQSSRITFFELTHHGTVTNIFYHRHTLL